MEWFQIKMLLSGYLPSSTGGTGGVYRSLLAPPPGLPAAPQHPRALGTPYHPSTTPPQPPAPTPTAPRWPPSTAPSTAPSTHPDRTPHHPTQHPLHSPQHPPPRHPPPPRPAPPPQPPAPAPTAPHATPSTAPSAAPSPHFPDIKHIILEHAMQSCTLSADIPNRASHSDLCLTFQSVPAFVIRKV